MVKLSTGDLNMFMTIVGALVIGYAVIKVLEFVFVAIFMAMN